MIHIEQGESIDIALRRFKRAVQKSGVLIEARKHEYYEKPSVRRRTKSLLARRRLAAEARKLTRPTYAREEGHGQGQPERSPLSSLHPKKT